MPDTVYHSFCDTIFCNQTPFLTSTKPITHLIQSAILTHAKITTTNKPVNRLSTKGDRHADDPHEDAVEKERDHCLATRTQGKICRMQECILRHKDCLCHDQVFCQMSCRTVSVIQLWKQRRDQEHHNRNTGTAHHRKGESSLCPDPLPHPSCRHPASVLPLWLPNHPGR